MVKKLVAFLTLFIFSNSYAVLEFEDAAYPELITSARSLAMGNAFINKADDAWSAFYNPAGLGSARGYQFHLFNFSMELNSGFLDLTMRNGSFTDSFSKLGAALSYDGLKKEMIQNPGLTSHARFQLFPNITFRGITLGYLYSRQSRARLKDADADFETAQRADSGPVMALSGSLFGGIFKFGASAVYLMRNEFKKDFKPGESISIDESVDEKQGSMLLLTAGTRLTIPVATLPTFSLVVRNSSNTEWGSPQKGGAPDKIPQTVDAGISITPIFASVYRANIELNLRDLGNRYKDVQSQRKISMGLEFDYARMLFVRFGYGDGWGSFGIGAKSRDFTFDFTTYAVELGEKFREQEDRRWVISTSSGF